MPQEMNADGTELGALRADVLARVDGLEGQLSDAISKAVRIESVNPKYPGEVYAETVGGEGKMEKRAVRVGTASENLSDLRSKALEWAF
jgi:hypothetical protein